MRPRIVFILTIALSLYNSAFGFAQSVKDSKGPPPPNDTRTVQLPIDDNITILLIIGTCTCVSLSPSLKFCYCLNMCKVSADII